METHDGFDSDAQQKQQLVSDMLPKESEQMGRKRPLAIQELLEKKKARLANGIGSNILTEEEANGKTNMGNEPQNRVDNEFVGLVEHLCNGELDNEVSCFCNLCIN